jgi:hypothetical protein
LCLSRDRIITPGSHGWCISRSQALSTFAIDLWPSRNCPIRRSRRRGQARQPGRDGAKRSGLTAPTTAGQSRVVMATLSGPCDAQREHERNQRDAQDGRQAGGDGAMPSQAEIQCECAFTFMNAFSGKNLTGMFSSMKSLRVSRPAQAAHSAMAGTERGSAGRQRHASGA